MTTVVCMSNVQYKRALHNSGNEWYNGLPSPAPPPGLKKRHLEEKEETSTYRARSSYRYRSSPKTKGKRRGLRKPFGNTEKTRARFLPGRHRAVEWCWENVHNLTHVESTLLTQVGRGGFSRSCPTNGQHQILVLFFFLRSKQPNELTSSCDPFFSVAGIQAKANTRIRLNEKEVYRRFW